MFSPRLDSPSTALEELEPERVFWRRGRWWRQVIAASAGVLTSNALVVVGTLIAARGLGPAAYGVVVLAVAIAALIANVFDISLEEAIVHYGWRARATEEPQRLRPLVRQALRINTAITLLIALITLVAAPYLADLWGHGLHATAIQLALLSSITIGFDGTSGGMLLVAGRAALRAWCTGVAGLVRIAAVVVALGVGATDAVLIAFGVANLASTCVQGALAYTFGWRKWPDTHERGRVPLRQLMGFGVHTTLSTALIGGNQQVMPLVLGAVSTSREVGLFSVALVPVTVAATATSGLRLALFPEQAKLAARGRFDTLKRSIRSYVVVALAVGTAGAAIGYLILPTVLPKLYSAQFADAILPARIALLAAVAKFTYGWSKSLPAAIGKPWIRTIVSLVELVGTAAGVALVGRHGVAAACWIVAVVSGGLAIAWVVLAQTLLRAPPHTHPAAVPSQDPKSTSPRTDGVA